MVFFKLNPFQLNSEVKNLKKIIKVEKVGEI